jgi:hypothetical protein
MSEDFRIGMVLGGRRYVYDRNKVNDDVDAKGFVCPPGAIVARGFTNAKAARDWRSLHRRTSFAAPVRARLGPRGFQPATKRA